MKSNFFVRRHPAHPIVKGKYRVKIYGRETPRCKTQWLGDNRESDSMLGRHLAVRLGGLGTRLSQFLWKGDTLL